jgi:hypothetical protein
VESSPNSRIFEWHEQTVREIIQRWKQNGEQGLTQILHHSRKGLQREKKYEKKGVVVINSNNDYGKHR